MPSNEGYDSVRHARKGEDEMPKTFCRSCGKQIPPEEAEGTTKEGFCYDCAASEAAVSEESVPLPPVPEPDPSAPGAPISRTAIDASAGVDEEVEGEDEAPSWLPDRLTSDERSWIRERATNVPPAGFVVGALFVIAWLGLVLGLIGSVGAGIAVADCQETLTQECDDATLHGFIVFAVGAGSTVFGSLLLWGFAHLIDLSLDSRERLEDLFFEQVRGRPRAGRKGSRL